jgi:hypothetical protein
MWMTEFSVAQMSWAWVTLGLCNGFGIRMVSQGPLLFSVASFLEALNYDCFFGFKSVFIIDISQHRLLFGFFCYILYRPCSVWIAWQRSPPIRREICGGGGQIVFLNLTTIIYMAALSTIHDVTGRRLVSSIYSWGIYGFHTDFSKSTGCVISFFRPLVPRSEPTRKLALNTEMVLFLFQNRDSVDKF